MLEAVPCAIKAGSVGRAIPSAEIRIVDDDGDTSPKGESGEVWLRGPMIMKGYHNLPKETAEILTADGYFKTGDPGVVDDEGYLHITGRKKDLIIVEREGRRRGRSRRSSRSIQRSPRRRLSERKI